MSLTRNGVFVARCLVLSFALLGSVSSAPFEVAADDMRDIEDTFKSLDSNVSLKDPKAAAEAQELVAYFKKVEGFYAAKPETADAVGFARKTHTLAAELAQSVQARNFDAAVDTVGQLTRSCKACHDVYKQQ
jgi:hypothetical protein